MGKHCGPCNKWYTKLIPDLIFSQACKKHDEDYDKIIKDSKDYIQYMYEIKKYKGNILNEMADSIKDKRKQADLVFLINMTEAVKERKFCYIKRKIYFELANIYYETVREKGGDSVYVPIDLFHSNQKFERDKWINQQIKNKRSKIEI